MAEEKKSFDINKWLGWLTAIGMFAVWIFTLGVYSNRLSNLENESININIKIDKQQEYFLKQQEFNGKVLSYIELKEKKNEK